MRLSPPLLVLAFAVACNDIPEGGAVSIGPELAFTTDELVAEITETPVDKNELTYIYTWSVDGSEVSDLEGPTVPPERTTKGEVWSVVVSASDGKVVGNGFSAEITIQNTPPEITEVSGLPQSPTTVDDLEVSVQTADADDDAVTNTITWAVDGVDAPVEGATLPSDLTAKGEVWVASVQPNDGEVDGVPRTIEFVIGNEAPVADSVTLDPSEGIDETVLVEAVPVGSDLDGDTLTWSYTWYVAGAEVKSGEEAWIDGTLFAKGDTLVVEATPNDGSQDGNTVTSDSAVVGNATPFVEGATVDPSNPTELSVLSCTPVGAGDPDDDALSYDIIWYVGGREVAESPTLDGDFFDRGDQVSCQLTPTDGEDAGEPVTSASVTVGNSPPSLTSVTIDPASPDTTMMLTALPSGATDPDGDEVSYTYAWSGGSSAATTATYPSSNTSKGDSITVTVTPTDGTDTGTPVTATVTIVNAAPTAPVVDVTPDPAGASDDLVCELTTASVDPDGDRISYTFSWTKDGTAWSGKVATTTYAGDTIDATSTGEGETWACVATPSDGTDTGTSATDSVKISSCGDRVVRGSEEYDPPPGPFTNVKVDTTTCRWDFSKVEQLYCNGSCSWSGSSHCDKADADVFCQLKTGNPRSTSTSYRTTSALAKPGFPCAPLGYGTTVKIVDRGWTGRTTYQDTSILANHGGGTVVTDVVCTNP